MSFFFLNWPSNRWTDRAEILHSLWGILCATSKNFDRVRSGHGAVKSLKEQPPTDFSRRSCFQPRNLLPLTWMEILCYAWLRPSDDHIRPLTFHLDRSKVIRGHWSWLTPYVLIEANLVFLGGFLRSWDRILVYFLHGHVPLYTIRCQSGPVAQFALRRFCRCGWRCSLLGHYAPQIFHQETITTLYVVQNWTRNTPVKVLCRYDW